VIQKKICMLGAYAVGKTSLVGRFVRSMFSEKYQTTVGVKIDQKTVNVGDQQVNMMLWDLHGEDEAQKVRLSYLRGASGYILVVDGTRKDTLDIALNLHATIRESVGDIPCTLVVNKSDLAPDWEIDPAALDDLAENGWEVIRSSAKSGEGVEEAFLSLASRMI